MREVISTPNAPAAIGPYSQAIRTSCSNLLFVSGQLGLDPKSGTLVSQQVDEQAKQALSNMISILEASGFQLTNVVKATIFLKDMNDFAVVNQVYQSIFERDAPARSTVEVARLPKDAKVEIEVIAAR